MAFMDNNQTNATANTGTSEFPTNSAAMTAVSKSPDPIQIMQPQGSNTTNISQGSSGSGGSDIGSTIANIGLKVLPIIGGFLADGGQVNSPDPKIAAGMGYLVGALHQSQFGGDPAALEKTVQFAKELMQQNSPSNTSNPLSDTPRDKLQRDYDSPMDTDENIQTNPVTPNGEMNRQGFQSMHNKPNRMSQGGEVNDNSQVQKAILDAMGLGQHQQMADNSATVGASPQTADQNVRDIFSSHDPDINKNMLYPEAWSASNKMRQELQHKVHPGFAEGGAPLQPGQEFQGDGSVKGPGGPTEDAIPAKLSNGEFVMSAAATKFFGVDKLVQMNEKGKAGFMQALGAVDQNQQQPPSGAPGQMSPQGAPQMPQQNSPAPVMMQAQQSPPQPGMAKGGPTYNPNKGYCGL